MGNAKNAGEGNPGVEESTLDTAHTENNSTPVMDVASILKWLPYALVWNEKRQKFDKIPHNGYGNVSTTAQASWRTLADARELAKYHNLPGVTLNMTGGIEQAGWRLVGFDYDSVDFEHFELPFHGYAERSPSGTGVRSFVFAPASFLKKHKDVGSQGNAEGRGKYPNCDHVEIYFDGTARHLTVTFDAIVEDRIHNVSDAAELELLASMLNPPDKPSSQPSPDLEIGENVSVELEKFRSKFKPEQWQMIEGQIPVGKRNEQVRGVLGVMLDDCRLTKGQILATCRATPGLWDYFEKHNDAEKFANEEIDSAYKKSMAARYDQLAEIHPTWKDWRNTSPADASDAEADTSIFAGPAQARCIDLSEKPKPREFIVAGVIPAATNGVLIAPGGVGKTTLTLHEAIHIILGRDVWRRKVLRPGGALFLTGEDSRADYHARLFWLMEAMKLSLAERKRVTDSIFIEDVSDRIARLAELDRAGNIVMTPHVDDLCRLYAGEGLAVVNIDPLVYFGPGERLVNDAEAAMCQVTKRFSHELGAFTRLVHHTGKEVARNGIVDQYAGRNGSSLADNSRQVMQIVDGTSKGKNGHWPLPVGGQGLLSAGFQALQVHIHKVSYAPKPKALVWVFRNGWEFLEFDGGENSAQEMRKDGLRKIRRYLIGKLAQGIYCSRTSLENDCTAIELAQRRIRVLVNEALQTGELVELELPEDKKQGKLTHYLAPGKQQEEDAPDTFKETFGVTD